MLRTLSKYIMARSYDRVMQRSEKRGLGAWRAELLAKAQGQVLEIGAGTGSNLPYYPPQTRPLLSEPDRQMRTKLQRRLQQSRLDWQVTDWGSAAIDLPDASLDSIVSTLVLCSVEDLPQSLAELYRLLKPGGSLLFLEHVAAAKPTTLRWQQRIEPLWSYCCGNCHLTRDTGRAIRQAGFQLTSCNEAAMPGAPALVSRTIRGVASKPAAES